MNPEDLLSLDEDLPWEARAVGQEVSRFLDEALAPRVADLFAREEAPLDLYPALGAMGCLGPFPAPPGEGDPSSFVVGEIMRALERVDSGIRSMVSVQSGLVMEALLRHGSPEQQAAWKDRLARGEAVGAFCLTEPDHGSDPAAIESRARRLGRTWELTGVKRWITCGPVADLLVVFARLEGDGPMLGFLVPADRPGVERLPMRRHGALRASSTGEVRLDRVQVDEAERLPGVTGLGPVLQCLTAARFGIAYGVVGAAEACLREALTWCTGRRAFGRPLAAHQLVQAELVEMAAAVSRMKLLAHRLALLRDQGRLAPEQVSLGKRENARAALEVARRARALLAATGISLEVATFRHMVNLEAVATYEGTHEIHTLALGRALTGLGAFGREGQRQEELSPKGRS